MPTDSASMPAGILQTSVEADGKSMTIDYDPGTLSDESVRQIAAKLAPEAQRRFDKCVMRLGGRACEACALKLERKAEQIEGVRRARATFVGGVMSVTFDNAQLSPQRVIERVRQTGAPGEKRSGRSASEFMRGSRMLAHNRTGFTTFQIR